MKQLNITFTFLIMLFLAIHANIEAQNIGSCATLDPTEAEQQALPWYGNPNYLDNYISSITNAYSGNGNTVQAVEDRVRHRIPIHFWIFRGRNLTPNNVLDDGEIDRPLLSLVKKMALARFQTSEQYVFGF